MLKVVPFIICAISASGMANAGGYTAPVTEASPAHVSAASEIPVVSWEGAYIGGNLNYGAARGKATGALGDIISSNGYSDTLAKPDGGSVALRAGYDWQFGKIVAGLGGEYNLGQYKSGLSGIAKIQEPGIDDVKAKNVGTVFGRVGYTFAPKWLGYGLLGYSWGKDSTSGNGTFQQSANFDGITYGVGVAYAVSRNWSAYGEYTYTDFGKVEIPQGSVKAELQQVKLGVNYRF